MAGYYLASVPICVLFILAYPFGLTRSQAYVHVVTHALATLALFGSLMVLRYTLRLSIAGHVGSAIAFVTCTYACYQAGGIAGPAAVWLVLTPVVSIMFLGRGWHARGWVLTSMATAVAFAHAHLEGQIVPPVPPDLALYTVNILGALIFLVLLFSFYDSEGDHFFQQLVEMRDRAREASRAKSAFLANTSHEMRTPLTAVLGFSDLLREELAGDPDPERCGEMVDTIRRNGRHLLAVINDVLDLSRVESGRLELESGSVRVRDLVTELGDIIRPRVEQKGLELEISIDADTPPLVAADPTRLRQVLLNLLDNAVRFTDEGAVELAVEPRQVASLPGVGFSVIDTGIGMTPAQMQRVFEPFTQADPSTTRTRGGTGLGLSIAKRIVDLMGGAIDASSEPGTGSRFQVTLPVGNVNEAEEPLTPIMAATGKREELAGMRILVAEDGPDNQRLIKMILTKAGAEALVARDGEEAVQAFFDAMLAGKRCQAILMDMDMPRMDGYDATRLLRDRGCDVPIIALTAHALHGDRERCTAAGCDDYLTKPIDRLELVSVLAARIAKAD